MFDTHKRIWLLAILLGLWTTPVSRAGWFDAAWSYRRPITITWDDQHPAGEQLASCIFYTHGHAQPNGEDVRVTTGDEKLVPSHVLLAGPGDRIRVVFALQKGERDYDIYFGNPHPLPPPQGMDDVHYKCGLLLQTKAWTGGATENFNQIQKSFERSTPELGEMMTDAVFLGYNPFGPQEQWISKFSGSLLAPVDGDYFFALAADDDAALYIDDKPIIFAPLGGGDIRYHATLNLTQGQHDIVVYHVNKAGSAYVSLGWRPPNTDKVVVVPRDAFGICYGGLVGPLEQRGKTFIADFSVNQAGECFYNDNYSFHYHFSGKTRTAIANKFEWHFGDGQTSTEAEADHVYLKDGIYTVKLTDRIGENSDTQSCQVAVSRNYAHILDAKEEAPGVLSAMIQKYDVNAISADCLNRALQLHLAADQLDAAVPIADKIAAMKSHSPVDETLAAFAILQRKLTDTGKVEKMVEVLDRVPANSDLQPYAARHAADLALWYTGDFDKAVKLLKPFQDRSEPPIHRVYAQALLLSGKADEGRKILEGMNSPVPPNRKAALSGAAARTVEFFITEKDAESGEEAWERWQSKFPADFLEGYSVVLRTKLMELRNRPEAAAKLAEAFASAVPMSPYAPQLLDRASKLLASADPTKSQALRQLLKQKYPEDPLSQ